MGPRKKTKSTSNRTAKKPVVNQPRCVAIADKGVKTGAQFADLMSALIGDIATSRIAPRVANAMCNAGGKLLKVVEMEQKYGTFPQRSSRKTLLLSK